VEDEGIVALNLQHTLTKLGYEVSAVVPSGSEALDSIEKLGPDIVLMDIHLQGDIDGIETANHIFQRFKIPVVYLTAHAEGPTLDRARATQPYGYLIKPFSERELHATLQVALERRRVDFALQTSEERLRLALDAANMGTWEMETQSREMMCHGLALDMFCIDEGNPIPWDQLTRYIHREDLTRVTRDLQQCLHGQEPCHIEFRSQHTDGGLHWLRLQGKTVNPDHGGQDSRMLGVVQDVSQHKWAEIQLQRAATVFESTQDGIVIVDKDMRVVTANLSYCQMSGYALTELIDSAHFGQTSLPAELADEILATLEQSGLWRGEIPGRRKTGELFPTLTNIAAVRDADGQFTHYVIVCSDLTSVHSAQQQLYHLAHHDSLTGLPNRMLAHDRLACALDWAKRRELRVAVLFIDIDNFKQINDSLGHGIGDALLCKIAENLRDSLRAEDTVARLGGDEFMVVLPEVRRSEEVAILAEKIVSMLNKPTAIAGTSLSMSASIGISLYPDDGIHSSELIRAADTAMYAAKAQGRRRYVFYTAEMTANAIRYMEMNQDLRRGLAMEELRLHYQPQMDVRSGRMVAVEALIRWQHPYRGLLGAAEIIPVAEESGSIVEIGDWVIQQACRQTRQWLDEGLPPLRIAINVSIRQIYQQRLINTVREALARFSIPSHLLEVEITESTLQSESVCLDTLQQLKDLGVSLAVDDFGTGYSCLSSLKTLPIHRIKIDRTFVRDIPRDENDLAIVEAIVAMAHRLKLQVLAEGVETAEQEQFLRRVGCDEVQGYLYARPLPSEEIALRLRAGSAGPASAS
jgi:diguanylate cyclase (GGDEF)-like protein/PAS domain S-box-containing protein